jgi:hypothetical protein
MHRARHVFLVLLVGALLGAPAARSASSDMVVSQVHAGGGNSGASFANDFVELFNRGATTIDIGSWSIQYASASGTSWQTTPLSGSVPSGGYYLVQLASAAAIGAPLPTPDATGTTNLANSGGKVALVRSATALTCGASAGSCSADPLVADLIGYGSATDFEGSGAAGALSNTTAAVRGGEAARTPMRTRATSRVRRPHLATRRSQPRRAAASRPPAASARTRVSMSTSSPRCRSRSSARTSASATRAPETARQPSQSASPSPATTRRDTRSPSIARRSRRRTSHSA